MKTKTIGNGITQKQVPELTTPEAVREFREAHNGDVLARIEAQAKATLRKAGLKTVPHLNDPPETQTPEWYAQEALWRFRTLDSYIRRGLSREAAAVAFHIGAHWREAEIKFRWEEHALRGMKIQVSARKGHERIHGTEDQKQARWVALQADLDSLLLNPKNRLSLTGARKKVAKMHGISYGTVRRRTKDPR